VFVADLFVSEVSAENMLSAVGKSCCFYC